MSAGVEGLRVDDTHYGSTRFFSCFLTQATVDVHRSQVVEVWGSCLWRVRSGLVSLSWVFPAVLWGAVSLSFSVGVPNGFRADGDSASRVES